MTLQNIIPHNSVAEAFIIIFLISAMGLWFGSIKLFKIKLGLAGVLFVGLFFGHLGFNINHEYLEFMREFGLILFVYTIGVQVGPGFFASFTSQGLRNNILAATIVSLGAVISFALVPLMKIDPTIMVGLFSGATTNTPSLGASQQILKELPTITADQLKNPSIGYAVAYPFGIIGIILSLWILRKLFGIDLNEAKNSFLRQFNLKKKEVHVSNILISNPNINGVKISEIPGIQESEALISRVLHKEEIFVANSETLLYHNDIVLVVGDPEKIEKLKIVLGEVTDLDLRTMPGQIRTQRILITHDYIIGKTPRQLALNKKFDVTLTRVHRGDIELTATSKLQLQFGDRVTCVGSREGLEKAAKYLGNSLKKLEHTEIVPFFLGIALGLFVGSIPFYIPGISVPIKLGLAGGPLIVAIILSRLGHIGKLIWYMPFSANLTLREFGIMIFLACVGLKSGGSFFENFLSAAGLQWILAGALITFIPIFSVGLFAVWKLKMNYLSVCGLLSGSMTDPPALAYATELTESDAPAVTYASVYPLTMVLRILLAQILVMVLF